jgi:hypothetical protein
VSVVNRTIANGRNAPEPLCGDVAGAQKHAHCVAYCLVLALRGRREGLCLAAADFTAHASASNG